MQVLALCTIYFYSNPIFVFCVHTLFCQLEEIVHEQLKNMAYTTVSAICTTPTTSLPTILNRRSYEESLVGFCNV